MTSTAAANHTYSRDTLITTSTAGNFSVQIALNSAAGLSQAKAGSFISARKLL